MATRRAPKVSCDDCYFRAQGLCALPGDERWSRLPASARELNSIARIVPGRAELFSGANDLKRHVFALGGKSSGKKLPPVADGAPPRADQLNLTLAGGSAFVTDPNGNIVALDPKTLARKSHLTDGNHPHSLALAGGKAYVANDSAVISYGLPGLAPHAATRARNGADRRHAPRPAPRSRPCAR